MSSLLLSANSALFAQTLFATEAFAATDNILLLPSIANTRVPWISGDDGLEGPAGPQLPIAQLRSAFEKYSRDQNVLPPSLKSLFEFNKTQILSDAENRLLQLSRLQGEQKVAPPDILARSAIQVWVKKTRVSIIYSKYKKMVEGQGLKAWGRELFRSHKRGATFRKFMDILNKGIKPGARVKLQNAPDSEICTVKFVTATAQITFKEMTGHFNATSWELVEEPNDN